MSRRRLAALVVGAVAATAALGACGDHQAATPTTTSAPQTTTTGTTGGPGAPAGAAVAVHAEVVGSFDQPTVLLARPGDPDHLYVGERTGHVLRVSIDRDGSLTRVGGDLLDISRDTTVDAERGLLGLAFSADGDTIYVSSTNAQGNSRLTSYAMHGDAVDASSARVILAQHQPYPNHNGGDVVLGPDGKLWFGFGDGGLADDPHNNAQDPGTLLGKIIRFTPGRRPEIVVSGVRNPWRFSFDTDGSLWIGDVGQNQYEEVDHLAAGHIVGANLGWSGYEGTHPYETGAGRRPAHPVAPILDYSHDGGNCSIIGGFVYRGAAIAALRGRYLFVDYCAGDVRAIVPNASGGLGRELDLAVHVDSPTSFGTDQAGEVYVLSQTGSISRLLPGR